MLQNQNQKHFVDSQGGKLECYIYTYIYFIYLFISETMCGTLNSTSNFFPYQTKDDKLLISIY